MLLYIVMSSGAYSGGVGGGGEIARRSPRAQNATAAQNTTAIRWRWPWRTRRRRRRHRGRRRSRARPTPVCRVPDCRLASPGCTLSAYSATCWRCSYCTGPGQAATRSTGSCCGVWPPTIASPSPACWSRCSWVSAGRAPGTTCGRAGSASCGGSSGWAPGAWPSWWPSNAGWRSPNRFFTKRCVPTIYNIGYTCCCRCRTHVYRTPGYKWELSLHFVPTTPDPYASP